MTDIERSYASAVPRLVVLALGMFLVGTNAFVIAGLLPDIADSLGASPQDVSYSITWYSVVVAIGSPAISLLAARISRTTVMTVGLVVIALGSALAASAGTLPVFEAGRVIAGVGGAALVPTATAAAASLVPANRRGSGLALVGSGFALATALGSPLGTAIGGIDGWRLPLWVLVGMAGVLALVVPLSVRDVPLSAVASVRERLGVLRDPRVVAPLVATTLFIAGFNAVYIFSSGITAGSTDGSTTLLSLLLLAYGIAGIAGTVVAGPLTDRFGALRVGVVGLTALTAVMALLPLAAGSFALTAIVFALWGLAAAGPVVPVQHRLTSLSPERAGITLSWYSTALYVGIAIAPLLGSAMTAAAGVDSIPVAGAVVTVLALVVFAASHVRPRPRLADA